MGKFRISQISLILLFNFNLLTKASDSLTDLTNNSKNTDEVELSEAFLKCSSQCSAEPGCLGLSLYKFIDEDRFEKPSAGSKYFCQTDLNTSGIKNSNGRAVLVYKVVFRNKKPSLIRKEKLTASGAALGRRKRQVVHGTTDDTDADSDVNNEAHVNPTVFSSAFSDPDRNDKPSTDFFDIDDTPDASNSPIVFPDSQGLDKSVSSTISSSTNSGTGASASGSATVIGGNPEDSHVSVQNFISTPEGQQQETVSSKALNDDLPLPGNDTSSTTPSAAVIGESPTGNEVIPAIESAEKSEAPGVVQDASPSDSEKAANAQIPDAIQTKVADAVGVDDRASAAPAIPAVAEVASDASSNSSTVVEQTTEANTSNALLTDHNNWGVVNINNFLEPAIETATSSTESSKVDESTTVNSSIAASGHSNLNGSNDAASGPDSTNSSSLNATIEMPVSSTPPQGTSSEASVTVPSTEASDSSEAPVNSTASVFSNSTSELSSTVNSSNSSTDSAIQSSSASTTDNTTSVSSESPVSSSTSIPAANLTADSASTASTTETINSTSSESPVSSSTAPSTATIDSGSTENTISSEPSTSSSTTASVVTSAVNSSLVSSNSSADSATSNVTTSENITAATSEAPVSSSTVASANLVTDSSPSATSSNLPTDSTIIASPAENSNSISSETSASASATVPSQSTEPNVNISSLTGPVSTAIESSVAGGSNLTSETPLASSPVIPVTASSIELNSSSNVSTSSTEAAIPSQSSLPAIINSTSISMEAPVASSASTVATEPASNISSSTASITESADSSTVAPTTLVPNVTGNDASIASSANVTEPTLNITTLIASNGPIASGAIQGASPPNNTDSDLPKTPIVSDVFPAQPDLSNNTDGNAPKPPAVSDLFPAEAQISKKVDTDMLKPPNSSDVFPAGPELASNTNANALKTPIVSDVFPAEPELANKTDPSAPKPPIVSDVFHAEPELANKTDTTALKAPIVSDVFPVEPERANKTDASTPKTPIVSDVFPAEPKLANKTDANVPKTPIVSDVFPAAPELGNKTDSNALKPPIVSDVFPVEPERANKTDANVLKTPIISDVLPAEPEPANKTDSGAPKTPIVSDVFPAEPELANKTNSNALKVPIVSDVFSAEPELRNNTDANSPMPSIVSDVFSTESDISKKAHGNLTNISDVSASASAVSNSSDTNALKTPLVSDLLAPSPNASTLTSEIVKPEATSSQSVILISPTTAPVTGNSSINSSTVTSNQTQIENTSESFESAPDIKITITIEADYSEESVDELSSAPPSSTDTKGADHVPLIDNNSNGLETPIVSDLFASEQETSKNTDSIAVKAPIVSDLFASESEPPKRSEANPLEAPIVSELFASDIFTSIGQRPVHISHRFPATFEDNWSQTIAANNFTNNETKIVAEPLEEDVGIQDPCVNEDLERFRRNIMAATFSRLNGESTLLAFIENSECVASFDKHGHHRIQSIRSVFPGFPENTQVEAAGFLKEKIHLIDTSDAQTVYSFSYDHTTETYSTAPPVLQTRSEFLTRYCGIDLRPNVVIKAFGQLSSQANSCIIFDTTRVPIVSPSASEDEIDLARAINSLLEREFVSYAEAVFSWLDEKPFVRNVFIFGSNGELYELTRDSSGGDSKWTSGSYKSIEYHQFPN